LLVEGERKKKKRVIKTEGVWVSGCGVQDQKVKQVSSIPGYINIITHLATFIYFMQFDFEY
jgi:hypothetical protein